MQYSYLKVMYDDDDTITELIQLVLWWLIIWRQQTSYFTATFGDSIRYLRILDTTLFSAFLGFRPSGNLGRLAAPPISFKGQLGLW